MSLNIGFIGFGEVASVLSKPMRQNGAEVASYDVLLTQDKGRETLQRRALVDGIRFCTLPEVVKDADIIISTVTTEVAKEVASECAPYLRPGQVYVDLNSTAPSVKVEISDIIRDSNARFVEGVVLGAVGATGATTHILVGGEAGGEVSGILTRLGLNVSFFSPEIGKASMFKMLRSIFTKGMEALLLELLVSGIRAGIEEELWKDITEFMARHPFDRVASNWIQTHAVACQRRYHEMVQVMEAMRGIGVDPVMTSATASFFKRSVSLGLKEAFPEKPCTAQEVADFLDKKLG